MAAVDGRRVADVARDTSDIRFKSAHLLDGDRQSIRFDISEHDPYARLRESLSQREADAARTAGHKRGLAPKVLHVLL